MAEVVRMFDMGLDDELKLLIKNGVMKYNKDKGVNMFKGVRFEDV